MSNFMSMLAVEFNMCDHHSWSAWFVQLWYWIQTAIYRVLGLFADLLNIAFYIFGGVDISSTEIGSDTGIYDIEVGYGSGVRKNILDYFLFSETMTKAYMWLAILGLLMVVIFTIYKIIKQDYFEKAGPRSKGPIFRNVAISCISFLLVIPIFYLIVHASSILAVTVMDAMGMDASQFAGAKIFSLSWSDQGQAMYHVNAMLISDTAEPALKWMQDLQWQTMFTMLADGKHVGYDPIIIQALGNPAKWSGKIGNAGIVTEAGIIQSVDFFWYIYLVGVIVGIKSLYKLIKAMIQRIFLLMGLFLVAPSPISQYVLDDGTLFKSWLKKSIQQGLRLVVATMSFAIFLIVLSLIGNINFIAAFNGAINSASQTSNFNVSTDLLVYNEEPVRMSLSTLAVAQPTFFETLVNAFMQILMLMAAGGAIEDLDPILTQYITSEQGSSLGAGKSGEGVDAVGKAAMSVAKAGVGIAAGGIAAIAGGVAGGIGAGAGDTVGADAATDAMAAETADAAGIDGADGGSGGGDGGSGGGGGGTSTATEVNNTTNETPDTVENEGGENGNDSNETPDTAENEGGENGNDSDETPDTAENEGGENGNDSNETPDTAENEGGENGNDSNETPDTAENEGGENGNDSNETPDTAENEGGENGNNSNETNENKSDTAENEGGDKNGQGQSGGSSSNQNTQQSNSGTATQATSKLAAARAKAQKSTRLRNRIGRKVGMIAAGAGMGLVKGVVKGTLGALKTAVWNPVKSLLGKVGFDADKFGKDVASSYTSTRDAGRKSQMNRYNKKKAAVYNDLRQARLEDAATAHEQKGQEVSKAAGELQTAVDNENAAAKPVEEASGNAATAAMGAAGANANVDNDTRVQTPATDQAIDDLTEKRDDLISKNQAITKAYGSKEEMEAVVAATKGSNPAKYKEVKHALDTYNKNEKAISDTRADLATAKTQKAEHTKMVDTFSGKNAELEKLGITSETSFSDAKKIVAKSGSKELQDMFAKDNAKDMFENSNVKTARGANAEARRTQTELKDAQSKYNAAHDARVKKQEALTEKVGEMGKASALVNSLADTIEDANQVAPAENKYKRNFQKVEKGPVKDKVKNKRSAAAKAVSDGSSSVQDAVSGGTKSVMDNVAAMSGPKTISTVGELKAFATQKTAEARAKTAEAESKLDDFVAKNASMEITDISKSKPNHPVKTTLGEYVKNAGGSTGAVLNRLQSGLMNDERGKVFTPELTGLMDGYNTARANQRQATSNATHAAGAVGAMASVSASNVRRMEGIQTQYAETVERGKVINKVIASGGKDITEADRKVIGETLGMRGGSLKATSEKTIVERAKEAREKNTQRQVDLMKKADGVKEDNTKVANDMKGLLDSLVRSAGGKTDSKPTGQTGAPTQTINQNVVNNNNTTNTGGSSSRGGDNEGGDFASQFSAFMNAQQRNDSGVASELEVSKVMDRMQLEGLNHLNTMLSEMQKENQAIMNDVEDIKHQVGKDK